MSSKKQDKTPKKKPRNQDQQRAFAQHYVTYLCATKAALEANYSSKAAGQVGWRLLQKPHVQEMIQEERKKREERTHIDQDRVLLEAAHVAFCDIREAFDENGNLKDVQDLPEGVARAISGIEVIANPPKEEGEEVTYTKKVRFWDKIRAIQEIAKLQGLYAAEKKDLNIYGLAQLAKELDDGKEESEG